MKHKFEKIIPNWALDIIAKQYEYDPITGEVHRTTDLRGRRKVTSNMTGITYRSELCQINVPILVWYLHYKVWPTGYIGFLDDDNKNFKIANLIEQTPAEKGARRKSCNAMGKGVAKHRNKFYARMKKEGVLYWLGSYDTPELAAKAYETYRESIGITR